MKKKLFLFSLLITVLFACRKSDIETIQSVSLSVQVAYTAEDSALGVSKENIPVKIANLVNGQENTANTNSDGVAVFASIAPGNYTISAAKNYTAEAFYAATQVFVGSNVAYNATETQAINANANIKLILESGKIGDLVFKQIYYAGSNTKTGALFRDQFIEIYNNSNKVIYLDSLYVGSSFSENSTLSSGATTFDWSNAIGMQTGIGDPNKDYLYFKYLFMIPGNGTEHPLEPGKSFIIAQTALNHTQPYTDNNGNIQGITDPSLTVDLSKAEFEVNAVEYDRENYNGTGTFTPYKWDIDNPNVPNIHIVYMNTTNDWVMDNTGRDDFIMFKTSSNASSWVKYPDPTVTEIKNTVSSGLQVPTGAVFKDANGTSVTNIIDAVEIIRNVETQRTPKRLWTILDAAGTFVIGGSYSSQSLIRKTIKTVDGKRILQDTNNSANDFETKSKADPSKTDASFEK